MNDNLSEWYQMDIHKIISFIWERGISPGKIKDKDKELLQQQRYQLDIEKLQFEQEHQLEVKELRFDINQLKTQLHEKTQQLTRFCVTLQSLSNEFMNASEIPMSVVISTPGTSHALINNSTSTNNVIIPTTPSIYSALTVPIVPTPTVPIVPTSTVPTPTVTTSSIYSAPTVPTPRIYSASMIPTPRTYPAPIIVTPTPRTCSVPTIATSTPNNNSIVPALTDNIPIPPKTTGRMTSSHITKENSFGGVMPIILTNVPIPPKTLSMTILRKNNTLN